MGLEEIRRVEGSPWAREPALKNARPGSGQGQPRSYNPDEARTPKEALAYINRLYKAGRMEDLPALLRRSQVFREAWLMLQQSSPGGVETGDQVALSSCRRDNQVAAPPPVPYPGPPNRGLNPEAGPETVQGAGRGISPKKPTPAGEAEVAPGPLPAGTALHLLAAALRIYQSQDGRSAQEKESAPRLSLWV
jgi:hypothetical protein